MENEEQQITVPENLVACKIYYIRDRRVILDRDLAELYEVETKMLNQSVRRNIERFPDAFMFQLTSSEFEILKSQIVTSSWGGTRKLPYAFTEIWKYLHNLFIDINRNESYNENANKTLFFCSDIGHFWHEI